MTELSDHDHARLRTATGEYHEGLAILAMAPWRQGRSNPCNLYAVTTGPDGDWKEHPPVGHMEAPALAAAACDAHNAMLDLQWLLSAGLDVRLEKRRYTDGTVTYWADFGDFGDMGDSSIPALLAEARDEARREGIAP